MLERHCLAEESTRGIDTLRVGTPVRQSVFGELSSAEAISTDLIQKIRLK